MEPRTITLTERPEVPWDGMLLGWVAMVPCPLLAAAMWLAPPDWAALAEPALVLWAAALVLPAAWALALMLAVHASLWALGPVAARRGDAPLYFARLRPWQMAVPVLSLAAALAA